MLVRSTTLAVCVCFTATLSACAHPIPVAKNEAPEPALAPLPPIVLEVENHNWADVILFVVHDGIQTRFAQVAAAHNLSIPIPERLQGQMGVIKIAARRIGANDTYLSQAISVRGSSAVRFTIESTLARSSVGVW
jgi:hypothetical protein